MATPKTTKSTTSTGVKPRKIKAVQAPLKPLVEMVRASLDSWESWVEKTAYGVISPVQFLALVLWVLQKESTTPEQEEMIVMAWGEELQKAMRAQIVIPLHPVTYLAYKPEKGDVSWLLSIAHATSFLEHEPVGFDCAKVLEHFRTEAAKQSPGDAETLTYVQAKEQRLKRKGQKWTAAEIAAVKAELDGRKGEAGLWGVVAGELGIKEQTLRSNIDTADQKTLPTKTAAEGGLSGGVNLQGAWNVTRAA